MAAGQTKNPRIAFVPSNHLLKIVTELSETSGKSKASIVSEIMDEAAVVIDDQLKAYRKIASAPESARAVLQDYANQQVAKIGQAVIEFDKPGGKKRGRPPGRGAAKTG